MAKRKYSGSSYSPRTPRPRVKAFSPVSPTVQMLRRKMGFKALGKGLLRGVGRAVPYLGAALAAKDAYDFGKDVYNRFRTPTTVERAGTQNMMRAGRVGTARLAGKVRAKKRNSTKLKFKGKSTNFGLQVSGVHSTEEHRFTSKTNQVDADRYESIQIGHTTLPAKVVLLNVSRAMIKHCCLKIGAEIHNFSDGMVLLNKGYAFRNGDIFRWTYYPSWIDSADATSNFIITIVEGETFESFSRKLAVALTTLANGLGTNHLTSIRWHDFEYEPDSLDATNKIYPWVQMSMTSIMCEVSVKSSLKVQNRTINAVGDDDDGDDVDNVPLVGKIFKLKGNNMLNRSERRILRGVGANNTINNDVVLFDGISRQPPTLLTGDAIHIQPNSAYSAFNRPAEPLKPYDLVNCQKFSSININPGGIKTSVITQRFKLPLTFVIKLLCEDGGTGNTLQKYNPNLGYTQVMHLEKAIGSFTSSVSIAAEVQYDIWCAVTSKKESKYTNTVGMQIDYNVWPA